MYSLSGENRIKKNKHFFIKKKELRMKTVNLLSFKHLKSIYVMWKFVEYLIM